MEKEFPQRKPTRLRHFDYSQAGAYFVTICIQDRKRIVSEVVKINETVFSDYAWGYSIQLKPCGEIVKSQLLALADRFENVTVADYVVMPDHIHAILILHKNSGGASPSPTMSDVICVFKSLVVRACKQEHGITKMFQRSFSEHIIRDREDYETRRKYIYENPLRWYYKHIVTEDQTNN